MNKFEIEIVNYFDMEELVAEVYCSSFQWAKIFHKNKELTIQFYPHPNKGSWEFPFQEALKALEQAKNKLLKKLDTRNFFVSKDPIDPKEVNEQAQKVLEKILNHPEKRVVQYTHKIHGPVIDIEAPELGGVRFTGDGKEMMGFLEPKWFKK